MGADIRLLLPGERCLLCLGGLADPEGARRVLSSADAEREFYATRDWRRERAGSLQSLNLLAASVALRLWEDFVAERVGESTWVRVEFDERGQILVSQQQGVADGPCRLCGRMGSGEAGLREAPEVFGAV